MNRIFAFFLGFSFLLSMSSSHASGEGRPARVLYLGDSMSMDAFGKRVDEALRAQDCAVHTVVAGGASPYYWLKSYQPMPSSIGFWEKTPVGERRLGYVRAVPKLEDLIQLHRPDVVVVQTGINLYATLRSKRRSKEDSVREVTSLIDQMCFSITKAGALPYWILPPHSHEERYPKELQEELTTIMREAVGRYQGKYFASQEVTHFSAPYPKTDGIHYGPTEALEWAEKVLVDLVEHVKVDRERPALTRAAGVEPGQDQPARAPETGGMAVARAVPVRSSDVVVEETARQVAEVELELKLLHKSEIQDLSRLDYANALGVFEYEVVRDIRGNYPHGKIRVAQGIVFGKKYTGAAKAQIGSVRSLKLVPLSKYPSLLSWQIADDLLPDLDLPLYTPKLD